MAQAQDIRIREPIAGKQHQTTNLLLWIVIDVRFEFLRASHVRGSFMGMGQISRMGQMREGDGINSGRKRILVQLLLPLLQKGKIVPLGKHYSSDLPLVVQFDW